MIKSNLLLETNMVQYAVWPNCSNMCDFCLRRNFGLTIDKQKQLEILQKIRKNIDYIDWKGKFSGGVSLLGGELYNIVDKDVQDLFMLLVDDIIEKVLKVSSNKNRRYSTVSNGIYTPEFLYRVVDRIASKVGMQYVDMNFSYDLKHRFKSEAARRQVLENITAFSQRYRYVVGVLMILALYVIDMVDDKTFSIKKFLEDDIKGGQLCFLYPHKVHGGKHIDRFFYLRRSFLDFMLRLKKSYFSIYSSFVQSVKNSALYKYSGYYYRSGDLEKIDLQPILTDDKTEKNPSCGHSTLYKCYEDSSKCMLCDLMLLDPEQF